MEIRYSDEGTLLCTGGATRLAAALVENERFLLLNGDFVCEVDCCGLVDTASSDFLLAAAS